MRAPISRALGTFTLILLVMGVLPGVSFATEPVFPAQSCSFEHVQAASQQAIASGVPSLVTIPSGTCDWGSNELSLPGGVSLQGGGKFLTVIRGSALSNDALVTVTCSNGKTARFSDMTLIGKANYTVWDGGLALKGGCKDFKVFKARFERFIYYGVGVWGDARGVIFQSEFSGNYRANPNGGNAGYGIVIYGDGTWPALSLGTENAVFVEDNYFVANRHHIASNYGSRYVFRYNTALTTDDVRHSPVVDAHGRGTGSRGSRSWEIYNNTFSTNLTPGLKARAMIGVRGGDGVVFNNTLTNPATVNWMLEMASIDLVGPYPAPDQMLSGYFWNNSPTTLLNGSAEHFVLGRDYFLSTKPGYTPYLYPHPLRGVPQTPGSLQGY